MEYVKTKFTVHWSTLRFLTAQKVTHRYTNIKVFTLHLYFTTCPVCQLEFDPASMDGQMVLTNVHVTVQLNGHVASYKTAVPYSMMNMPTSALNMAMEYWGKAQ